MKNGITTADAAKRNADAPQPGPQQGVADSALSNVSRGPTSDPHATDPDPRAIGTRQPPHGVSQEQASNAMATHPTEVGGTRPTPDVARKDPDVPKPAA